MAVAGAERLVSFGHRGGAIGYYRPLTKLTFWLDYHAFGASPTAYHASNLAAHALAVWMLAVCLRRIAGPSIALLASALWAVHPMSVQAVATVAARSDLLAAGLSLATVAVALKWYQEPKRPALLVATLPLALMAVGSKEAALGLPLLVAGSLYAAGSMFRVGLLGSAPAVLGTLAYAGHRLWSARVAPLENALGQLSLPTDWRRRRKRLGATSARYGQATRF